MIAMCHAHGEMEPCWECDPTLCPQRIRRDWPDEGARRRSVLHRAFVYLEPSTRFRDPPGYQHPGEQDFCHEVIYLQRELDLANRQLAKVRDSHSGHLCEDCGRGIPFGEVLDYRREVESGYVGVPRVCDRCAASFP